MSVATNGVVVDRAKQEPERLTISPPAFKTIELEIRGTAPYLQARFSEKAMQKMADKMKAGSTARKGQAREARDFEADYHAAMHIAEDGWHGIPAAAFRNAAITACSIVGFHMTKAKMSVFVRADGIDRVDGTPLVRILGGDPERTDMTVRNETGVVDIRVRPMWRQWAARLMVRFDSDQFTAQDIVNLIARAGEQVGVGEGRPFSKKSNGLGFGLFEIVGTEERSA